jgi:hypothetical protein
MADRMGEEERLVAATNLMQEEHLSYSRQLLLISYNPILHRQGLQDP